MLPLISKTRGKLGIMYFTPTYVQELMQGGANQFPPENTNSLGFSFLSKSDLLFTCVS